MILPIYVYGSSILRKVAQNIDKNYPKLEQLIGDMYETMHISDGVGLAAPQIGRSVRIFVIDASAFAEDHPELAGFKKTFINANIVERAGDEYFYNEGCLSIPGVHEDVKRFDKIRIQYYDENFEYHDEIFGEIPARIIQHEYDHLEGVIFTDRISPIRKRILKGKLNGIIKGKFEAKYAVNQG